MNEKPAAGLVAALLILPLALLCCLGPAVVGSLLAGASAWLGGLGVWATAGAAAAGAVLVYGILRWRKAQHRHGGASPSSRVRG